MNPTMKKKILFSLLTILLSPSLWAQESHWQCNPGDFDSHEDMTAIVYLELDDQRITDLSNYEIAAFCGNECRGIMDVKEDGILNTANGQVGYIRIHTNDPSANETITFKVYDKTEQKEINVQNTKVTFEANGKIGSASTPFKLDITQRYTPGDTNDDGEIDLTDASLIFRYYSEFFEDEDAMADSGLAFVKEAADVNGDGFVDLTDASLVFRYYSEFFEDVEAMIEAGLTVLIPSN